MLVESKKTRILGYISVAMAGLNSIWLEMITLDDGHEIFSKYFFVDAVVLLTVFFHRTKGHMGQNAVCATMISGSLVFL